MSFASLEVKENTIKLCPRSKAFLMNASKFTAWWRLQTSQINNNHTCTTGSPNATFTFATRPDAIPHLPAWQQEESIRGTARKKSTFKITTENAS